MILLLSILNRAISHQRLSLLKITSFIFINHFDVLIRMTAKNNKNAAKRLK